MLSIAVNSASIIWNVIQIASTMTNKSIRFKKLQKLFQIVKV